MPLRPSQVVNLLLTLAKEGLIERYVFRYQAVLGKCLFGHTPEIEVQTREVLHRGASATDVPQHEHVPSPRPKALHADEEWLLVLRAAEKLIRWRSWTQPRLPLDERPSECAGGDGGTLHDSKGVAVWDGPERRYASWPALLRGLAEQREAEPHVADARDLAHAYHALEQYDRFYVHDGGSVGGGDDDDWRERVAIPYLQELKQIVADLGGDPELVLGHAESEGESG